jgi:hypothetical protein
MNKRKIPRLRQLEGSGKDLWETKVKRLQQKAVKREEWECVINPLTLNNLWRCRAVRPLKIKIPSKSMGENQQIQQLFFQFINYVW